MSLPALRPYQIRDINELREGFKHFKAGILCQPTGSGKGFSIAWMVRRAAALGHRTIFVVYGSPLVVDMYERIEGFGVEVGMIMGDGRAATRKPWCATQVASISTLWRRPHLPKADLVVVDEVQDITSRTYREVIGKYIESGARILGTSATPIGPGGVGLGKEVGGIFDFMVVGPSVKELIADGYLVGCRPFCFKADDLKGIRKKGDDLDQSALAALVSANADRAGNIVKTWKKYSSHLRTVAFGVDQADARRISDEFSAAGVKSTVVFDDTPQDERRAIWKDFEFGELRIICSVSVVGRGWDKPCCKCVIDAASTISLTKALQRWGRGSRPYVDHQVFHLHDHCGNVYRHGLYEWDRSWSLNGQKAAKLSDGDGGFSITTCPKCALPFRSGPRECPSCHYLIPINEREIHTVIGDRELGEIKPEEIKQKPEAILPNATWDRKRVAYAEMCERAKKNGYQSKWIFLTFLRTFGHPPPKKWAEPPDSREILTQMEMV